MSDDLIRVVTASLSAFVALILLRAALHKVADATRFAGILADYDLVPDRALRPLGFVIPCLELACALALAWGGAQVIGGYAAGLLLIGYGVAIAVNLVRGRREIDCGCGGAPEALSWALVARNLILSAMLVPVGLGLGYPTSVSEATASWAIALVAVCCWGAAEQLLVNRARIGAARRETLSWVIGATS
jgi:hypothetical protein